MPETGGDVEFTIVVTNNSLEDATIDSLVEKDLVTGAASLATAEADLLASEQEVRLAEIDVAHCDVRAPVDAVVTERATSVGSYANVGTVLLNLLEAEGQEVSVALRHDQADGLQAAETVVFKSDETDYPVMLRSLLPRVDPIARTREARLVFTDEAAVAGTPGRIVWYGARSMLPSDYLVRRDGHLGVFVLDADRARFIDIPDAQDGRPAVLQLAPETLGLGLEGLDDALVDGGTEFARQRADALAEHRALLEALEFLGNGEPLLPGRWCDAGVERPEPQAHPRVHQGAEPAER